MCDAIKELFADEYNEGMAKSLEQGIAIAKMVFRMDAQGKTAAEIAEACELTEEEVLKILTE